MFFYILKIILVPILCLALLLPNFLVLAENENLEEICRWERIEQEEQKVSKEEYKELLEKCQKYYNEKSTLIQEDLSKTQKEKDSLENRVYILGKKINNLDYQIYQNNLELKDISFKIDDTRDSIDQSFLRIQDSKKKLSDILRVIYEQDQKSILEILIGEEDLSAFFDNLIALERLNIKNQELLNSIKNLKYSLEDEEEFLGEKEEEVKNLIFVSKLQKQESSVIKDQQEDLLEVTEEEYQKQLKEKTEVEEQATKIRHRLFELIGVSSGGIEFGKAVEIAEYVGGITGVRASFLLAIIAQESMRHDKFGENVGQCYLKDVNTGNGVYIESGSQALRTMNPGRDVPYFLSIIKELNDSKGLLRDAFETPISCWIKVYYYGSPFGWGGAMGPAQFIPSTWVLYKDKVKESIGTVPDPWNIKESFLVAGFHLKDIGAVNNEWRAAMRYFSGYSWNKSEEYYGNSVISRANKYQKEIDLLGN